MYLSTFFIPLCTSLYLKRGDLTRGAKQLFVLSRKQVWKHLWLMVCFPPHVLKTHLPDCFWLFFYLPLFSDLSPTAIQRHIGLDMETSVMKETDGIFYPISRSSFMNLLSNSRKSVRWSAVPVAPM